MKNCIILSVAVVYMTGCNVETITQQVKSIQPAAVLGGSAAVFGKAAGLDDKEAFMLSAAVAIVTYTIQKASEEEKRRAEEIAKIEYGKLSEDEKIEIKEKNLPVLINVSDENTEAGSSRYIEMDASGEIILSDDIYTIPDESINDEEQYQLIEINNEPRILFPNTGN